MCDVYRLLIGGISCCFASEPTALEREQARVQWIAEHGQYQPNLTEPAKQEVLVYTEQNKQKLTALGVNNETDLQNLRRIGSKAEKKGNYLEAAKNWADAKRNTAVKRILSIANIAWIFAKDITLD